MTNNLRKATILFVLVSNSLAFSIDAQDVLAVAFAERSKVRSFDMEFVVKNDWGQICKQHVISEYGNVFVSRKFISPGVLPEGTQTGPEGVVFNGSTVAQYYQNAGQTRSFDTAVSRKIDTPFRRAFQWIDSTTENRDDERLGEWETWSSISRKVVEQNSIARNLVVLKIAGVGKKGGDDYMLVTFDADFGYFPVEERFFRNKTLIVETKCIVDWILDESGKKVVFPLRTDYHTFAGEGSFNSWNLQEVNRSSLRLNPVIDPVQFTAAALPKSKPVDVDNLNRHIEAQFPKTKPPVYIWRSFVFWGSITLVALVLVSRLLTGHNSR